MEVRAITKDVKISAFKAREVTRAIQGLPVNQALDYLMFSPRKASRLIEKTLKSAVANAENNEELDRDELVIKEAVVGEGRTMRRYRARARGGAGRIRKRSSHIRILLSDDMEPIRILDRADMDDDPKKKKAPKKRKVTAAAESKPAASAAVVQDDEKKEAAAAEETAKAEVEVAEPVEPVPSGDDKGPEAEIPVAEEKGGQPKN